MEKHIINLDELDPQPFPAPMPEYAQEKFGGAKLAFIGTQIGAEKLGYNLTVLPPGKRAFPFHTHEANEELFVIVEGSGEVRIGDERFPIRKGDCIACPPSGPAHQIVNTSDAELRYLAIATRQSPEIAHYPDTGKFGVLAKDFRFVGRADQSLDYWEGE